MAYRILKFLLATSTITLKFLLLASMVHRLWRSPLFEDIYSRLFDREEIQRRKSFFPVNYYFSLSILFFPVKRSFFPVKKLTGKHVLTDFPRHLVVWEILTNVWEILTYVWEILTNVWEIPI